MADTQSGHSGEHKTLNTVIHAAFRRDIDRMSKALASYPTLSEQKVQQIGAAWSFLVHQLHIHHHDEETLFWPAFLSLGIEQSLIDDLEAEHGRMRDALDAACAAMDDFTKDPTESSAEHAHRAMAALQETIDEHLSHEERDLEPRSSAFNERPEVKAAVKQARKSHDEGAGSFFAWLADGGDPAIHRALRHEVPPPVLFLLMKFNSRNYREIALAWA